MWFGILIVTTGCLQTTLPGNGVVFTNPEPALSATPVNHANQHPPTEDSSHMSHQIYHVLGLETFPEEKIDESSPHTPMVDTRSSRETVVVSEVSESVLAPPSTIKSDLPIAQRFIDVVSDVHSTSKHSHHTVPAVPNEIIQIVPAVPNEIIQTMPSPTHSKAPWPIVTSTSEKISAASASHQEVIHIRPTSVVEQEEARHPMPMTTMPSLPLPTTQHANSTLLIPISFRDESRQTDRQRTPERSEITYIIPTTPHGVEMNDIATSMPDSDVAMVPHAPIVPEILSSTLALLPTPQVSGNLKRHTPQEDLVHIATVVPNAITAPSGVKDLYFEFDQWRIPKHEHPKLLENVAWLKAHPEVLVTIEGHTDARGSTAYNKRLAQRRANAVQRALIALGIPEKRLVSVSYGNTQVQCVYLSDECHQESRRVRLVTQ